MQRHTIKLPNCTIEAKSENQSTYLDTIDSNYITFGVGQAGTGKSILAITKAIESLLEGNVNKIVLSRPAVEAGENLGFLPGSLQEKMDPFMAPLYDALNLNWQDGVIEKMMNKGEIEIVPVGYMRGRTFMHSFIILDEAQNMTEKQLKLALTRFGEGSKMVVTGDPAQCDLPRNAKSCLQMATDICDHGTEGVAMVKLDSMEDIQRHPVVANILQTLQDTGYDDGNTNSTRTNSEQRGSD